jgi:hypothetical protein
MTRNGGCQERSSGHLLYVEHCLSKHFVLVFLFAGVAPAEHRAVTVSQKK